MSIMNLTTLLLVLCVTATAYSLRISQTKSRVTQIRAVAPKSTRQQVITSRTHALAGIAIGLLAGVPQRASAFELFGSASQKAVNEVSSFQKPVYELLSQLRPSNVPNAVGVYSTTQQLKGGKEDSDVVLLYLLNYITPMQKRMEESAGKLGLADAQAQERLELLPKLMQGHMLELRAAIQSMKAEEQRKEVEEVYETLTEFLKLASSKYVFSLSFFLSFSISSSSHCMHDTILTIIFPFLLPPKCLSLHYLTGTRSLPMWMSSRCLTRTCTGLSAAGSGARRGRRGLTPALFPPVMRLLLLPLRGAEITSSRTSSSVTNR